MRGRLAVHCIEIRREELLCFTGGGAGAGCRQQRLGDELGGGGARLAVLPRIARRRREVSEREHGARG